MRKSYFELLTRSNTKSKLASSILDIQIEGIEGLSKALHSSYCAAAIGVFMSIYCIPIFALNIDVGTC